MKCPRCGSDIADGSKFCSACGYEIANNNQSTNQNNPQITFNTAKSSDDVKVPFYLRMWFIILVGIFTSFLFFIPAIVLFIIRIKKFPNNRKGAWIGLDGFASVFIFLTVIAIYFSEYDNREVDKLIKAGKYDEAIEYVEANYDSSSVTYYKKMADIYEKQGDYDSASSAILTYIEGKDDLNDIPDSIVNKLLDYKNNCSQERNVVIDKALNNIELAKAERAEKEKAEKGKDSNSVEVATLQKGQNDSTDEAYDEYFDRESLLEAREMAEESYNENTKASNGTVYIDECVVKEFHRLYEKYSPNSGESLLDYFGRAYGDMLEESFVAAQQGDSYDQFAGMHNEIKIGRESVKEKTSYDYNDLMNNTITASYSDALSGKYKDSLVKMRVQVQTAYENSYVVLPEKSEKYQYNIETPYVAYFTSNPITVTNTSDVEARHLLSAMKSNGTAVIIGKIIKTERIDGQEFPIIEIHLARKTSASEDLAISQGYIDYNKKCHVTNGANGYVEVRTEAGYGSEVERLIENGNVLEFSGYEMFDEEGEPILDDNGDYVRESVQVDGTDWYYVVVYRRMGNVYGWLPISDIGEDYVY